MFGLQYVGDAKGITLTQAADSTLAGRTDRCRSAAIRGRTAAGVPGYRGTVTRQFFPNATVTNTGRAELTLGGWRVNMGQVQDGGVEHGHCTVHEVVVFDEPLPDEQMSAVWGVLQRKWFVSPLTSAVQFTRPAG